MNRYKHPVRNGIVLFFVLLIVNPLVLFSQGFSPQTEARLQAVLEKFQNDPANPYVGGMSAAINVDGLALWQGATGYAARNVDAANNLLTGGTPFTIQTPSRIYSITKTFTAALILELVNEGILSLNDPVRKFLPLDQINPGLNGDVTISQLLAHESGYSDFLLSQDLQVAVAFQPTRVWSPFESISFAYQENKAGTVRKYSSTNYIILGAIIEVATGQKIEDLFRQRFFNPLHLSSMYLAGREPIGNRALLAAPHDNISALNPIFQLTGQPTFPNTYTNISRFPFTAIESISFTSGGIVSNVGDVARWGNDLFGGRATSKATLDMMLNSISSTPDEDGDYLGYGIFRTTKISATDIFYGHDGNATGYRSVMFYQPDRKMTIAILTNYHGAKLYEVAKALYEALPNFLCGNENRKEDKILLCSKGKSQCIARPAADGFIKKGAYLGSCEAGDIKKEPIKKDKAISIKDNPLLEDLKYGLTASPNPFKNATELSFVAEQSGTAILRVFDQNGKLVKTLFSGEVIKGVVKKVSLSGSGLSSGIYYSQLVTAKGMKQQKLVLQ
jgi:D-alanyl-D-alanine carboxypeptidase